MAEQMEITTWPEHKNLYYRVTTSAFTFEVKGHGNALIGLTTNLKKKSEYIIQMDYNSSTYIICNRNTLGTQTLRQNSPNLLSNTEYRRFWVSWYGDWIALGRDNESIPIISVAASKNNIKYVTFGTLDNRSCVHWRIDLAPLYKKPSLKPLSNGKVQWVNADTQLPDDALIGGYENEFLYIIRASHRGSLTPGKFVPSLGLGFVPWGGSSNEKSDFEVLCGHDCTWVHSHSNRIPVDAIEAGYSENQSERLYVGRVKHMGHLIPGKVQHSHRVCYIAYEDREIAFKEYEVLVCPNANPYSVSKYLGPLFGHVGVPVGLNDDYANEYEDDNGDDDDDNDEHYYNDNIDEDDFE